MTGKISAPAKVNLTLHVTGQRDDGYHLLDSLVVFANLADQITATPSSSMQLSVSGPFSQGVPTDRSNLAMRAALLLQRKRNVLVGAEISLEKHLPNAAGLGGGSADAAAVLRVLADLWQVDPLPAIAPEIVSLGADVPVCLTAPDPARMTGIGEIVAPVPILPRCALVLVNPRISVPTPQIFSALPNKKNAPMGPIPEGMELKDFAHWLALQRNDLLAPALRISPEIEAVLTRLRSMSQVAFAGMSGSGATCFALVADMGTARQVARAVQVSHMEWWVAPAEVLQATN